MMKVAISGSWRFSTDQLSTDLQAECGRIMDSADQIVTGGALGVDFTATQIAFASGRAESAVCVIIPTSLAIYTKHYLQRAAQGVISHDQAQSLIEQLEAVHEIGALVQMDATTVDRESYYARNAAVIDAADRLVAFQVNDSAGTQDAIDRARNKRMPLLVYNYQR